MDQGVDISVYVLTYYHEKYIRQALDSILSQKTSYNFEIVVSDDCSQDNTPKILDEYQKKYPDKIRININEKNLGIPRNVYIARCMCRGRYIVCLAGDDYWINDNKLQIQADFLESHPDYLVVCSRLECRYEDDNKAYDVLPKETETNKEYTMDDFEAGRNFNTHGLMMRNMFLTEEGRAYFLQSQKFSQKVDDAVDNYLMLRKGRVYTLNVVTDVYRDIGNVTGSHSYNALNSAYDKISDDIHLYNRMTEVFGKETNFKKRYYGSASAALIHSFYPGEHEKWVKLYKSIPIEYRKPFYKGMFISCIPTMIKIILSKIKRTVKNRR